MRLGISSFTFLFIAAKIFWLFKNFTNRAKLRWAQFVYVYFFLNLRYAMVFYSQKNIFTHNGFENNNIRLKRFQKSVKINTKSVYYE